MAARSVPKRWYRPGSHVAHPHFVSITRPLRSHSTDRIGRLHEEMASLRPGPGTSAVACHRNKGRMQSFARSDRWMCGITGWVDYQRDLRQRHDVVDGMVATMSCRAGRDHSAPVLAARRAGAVDVADHAGNFRGRGARRPRRPVRPRDGPALRVAPGLCSTTWPSSWPTTSQRAAIARAIACDPDSAAPRPAMPG